MSAQMAAWAAERLLRVATAVAVVVRRLSRRVERVSVVVFTCVSEWGPVVDGSGLVIARRAAVRGEERLARAVAWVVRRLVRWAVVRARAAARADVADARRVEVAVVVCER